MKNIKVNLKDRSYNIIICANKPQALADSVKKLDIGKDAVIITNNTIKNIYGKKLEQILLKNRFSVKFEVVPDSEKSKSSVYAIKLLNKIASYDVNKRLFVVALGGGVIGDLAGFVASAYKRGIPYIQVPTTLLAQVDSAIGGKVAIDLPHGKNLAGAFYQPRLVFSDISILSKLPKREVISGLAEVIKYGIILDRNLFNYLENNAKKIIKLNPVAVERIVSDCSRLKAKVVECDERETKGFRTILNFGHTIGHAIEAASGYSKIYTHGEAVAIGMLCATDISGRLGIIKEGEAKRISDLIKSYGFRTKIEKVKLANILKAMKHDKKFIKGKPRFVLPVTIGHVMVCENIPKNIVIDTTRARVS